MDEEKALALFGQGGLGAVLVAIIWVIGNRFIKSMDALIAKIDTHQGRDEEHHADVKEAIVALRTRVDTIVERADRERTMTPSQPFPRMPTGAP